LEMVAKPRVVSPEVETVLHRLAPLVECALFEAEQRHFWRGLEVKTNVDLVGHHATNETARVQVALEQLRGPGPERPVVRPEQVGRAVPAGEFLTVVVAESHRGRRTQCVDRNDVGCPHDCRVLRSLGTCPEAGLEQVWFFAEQTHGYQLGAMRVTEPPEPPASPSSSQSRLCQYWISSMSAWRWFFS